MKTYVAYCIRPSGEVKAVRAEAASREMVAAGVKHAVLDGSRHPLEWRLRPEAHPLPARIEPPPPPPDPSSTGGGGSGDSSGGGSGGGGSGGGQVHYGQTVSGGGGRVSGGEAVSASLQTLALYDGRYDTAGRPHDPVGRGAQPNGDYHVVRRLPPLTVCS